MKWPYWLTCVCFVGLIVLCVAWELFLAPIRPQGSWLVLKVLPLLPLSAGIFRARIRAFQIASLLVWLYFAEGATRVASDPSMWSRGFAGLEIALCLGLFLGIAMHLKQFKLKKAHEAAP